MRHRFIAVLGIGVCAVLAGARSFTMIAEWAQAVTPTVRLRLGLGRATPSESTIRRVLQQVDPEVLDAVVSAWLVARVGPGVERKVIAVDGKTARGARGSDGRAVHLLAAFDAGAQIRARPGRGGRENQ